MFRRFLNYLKALFGMKLDNWEDPEILLKQAQDEMVEVQRKNKERAVQAITQKNNLQNLVDQTQKTVDNLQAKAELALKNGDRDLARQLLVEKQQYETTLATTKQSLDAALQSAATIKDALRHEEERIRTKTAQALAMKAQWKQSQIEISINKALDGMSTDHSDAAFERAQAKISNAHSESSARTEIARERLDTRIASLDDAAAHSAADSELDQLEQKLGLKPSAAASNTTQSTFNASGTLATPSEIDRQLQQLEAKVNPGGGTGNGASPT